MCHCNRRSLYRHISTSGDSYWSKCGLLANLACRYNFGRCQNTDIWQAPIIGCTLPQSFARMKKHENTTDGLCDVHYWRGRGWERAVKEMAVECSHWQLLRNGNWVTFHLWCFHICPLQNFGFFTPPPCHCHISADFVSFVCFLGTPSPHPLRRRLIWKPPLYSDLKPLAAVSNSELALGYLSHVSVLRKFRGHFLLIRKTRSISHSLVRTRPLSRGHFMATAQRWPKIFALGWVIPPDGAVARSRNLGQTLFFVQLCTFSHPILVTPNGFLSQLETG